MRRAIRPGLAWPIAIFGVLAIAMLLPLGGAARLLLARVMVFALAALGLDLILGVGGMVSFGHAAPLAIGAYAVAMLDAAELNDAWIVVPTAMAAASLFALATGAIALRTRGVNFIMITLAFAQMIYFGAGSLADYGGDDGVALIARTEFLSRKILSGGGFPACAFALLLVGYCACRMLVASRFGRALRAVRQNSARAQALGYDPFAVRLTAYVIGAAICGVAGVMLANDAEFVSPAYAAWQRSGDLLIMVILGGAGSLHGAILGAAAVIVLEDGLGRLTEHWRLIYGPLLVLAVLFLPRGLAGIGTRRG